MKDKKYNHSFARKLTRWVMLVLFIMMGALAFLTYQTTKELFVENNTSTVHISLQAFGNSISGVMSDVSVAVKNNVFDVERNINQPHQLQKIMERIVRQNPRIRSCGISFVDNYFPQYGHALCPYAWQKDSVQVEGMLMTGKGETYLESEWFQEAIAADSAYWSKPFYDSRDQKTPLVAYMYPIHDQTGRLVAILGADLSLSFMSDFIQEQYHIFMRELLVIDNSRSDLSCRYVLANDGTYITHTDQRRILHGNFFSHIKDSDQPGMAEKIIKKMREGEISSDETEKQVLVNRMKSYLFYAPLEGTDWLLAVSMPVYVLNLIGVLLSFLMVMMFVIVMMATFLVCRIAIVRAAKPLKQLAATADQVANGQFDTPLPVMNSRDEIHLLRDSFDNMQHSLTAYIDELKETTTAKASIESELKIAHDIQMSMLPKTYPAFPDRHDIDIYGTVMPAKAVGGDLYDFFIRDEKLFFCIGDVSGKGVPASLVMAVTRSLFRNIASYTQDPGHIVLALNEALSANNDTGMFVTVFLGVLDLVSGLLTYTNAGHNQPLLLADGRASIITCDANLPVGVMPGMSFSVQSLQLKKDDTVFLYTDGLNEAEDYQLHQYGMERMMLVAQNAVNEPQPLIETMTESVRQFVGDAEQSDDLTMLAVKYTNS